MANSFLGGGAVIVIRRAMGFRMVSVSAKILEKNLPNNLVDIKIWGPMNSVQDDRVNNMREAARLRDVGWTKEHIAEQLGVHPRTVQDYFDELDGKATKVSRQALRRDSSS